MPSSNWTPEERERYAYITNNPVAPLLGYIVDELPRAKHDEGNVDMAMRERAQLQQIVKDAADLCAPMQ